MCVSSELAAIPIAKKNKTTKVTANIAYLPTDNG